MFRRKEVTCGLCGQVFAHVRFLWRVDRLYDQHLDDGCMKYAEMVNDLYRKLDDRR